MTPEVVAILHHAWCFLGIWTVGLVLSGALYRYEHERIGAVPILLLLAVTQLGGWFDFRTLLSLAGLPYWGAIAVCIVGFFFYADKRREQEIDDRAKERINVLNRFFEENGLKYTPGSYKIPSERQDAKEKMERLQSNNPIFRTSYVEEWYSYNKEKLVWWVVYCPLDFVINFFEVHLKKLILAVLESEVVQYPFEWVSAYYFDEQDLHYRALADQTETATP